MSRPHASPRPSVRTLDLFGVNVAIPDSWVPTHLYRFLIPAAPFTAPLATGKRPAQRGCTNLIISTVEAERDEEPAEILAEMVQRESPRVRFGPIIRASWGTLPGAQVDAACELKLGPTFQRRVVILGEEGQRVVLTWTADHPSFDDMVTAVLGARGRA